MYKIKRFRSDWLYDVVRMMKDGRDAAWRHSAFYCWWVLFTIIFIHSIYKYISICRYTHVAGEKRSNENTKGNKTVMMTYHAMFYVCCRMTVNPVRIYRACPAPPEIDWAACGRSSPSPPLMTWHPGLPGYPSAMFYAACRYCCGHFTLTQILKKRKKEIKNKRMESDHHV